MDPCDVHSPDWGRALALKERMASMRSAPTSPPRWPEEPPLSEEGIAQWRSQTPFLNDALFARHLEACGVRGDALDSLLVEPPDALGPREPEVPAWLGDLVEAFLLHKGVGDDPFVSRLAKGHGIAAFLGVIQPLVTSAREQLRRVMFDAARAYPNCRLQAETVENSLLGFLSSRLLWMISRTMVLELNVARLEGDLDAETPEGRFLCFVERMRQPHRALALLQEYPVLARQLMLCIDQWLGFSDEFLRRLGEDWQAIEATFQSGRPLGALAYLDVSAGDSHRRGRRVAIASFSSGFRLVYKPRALALDVLFQDLLVWLNQRGDHQPFRTLKVLDRGAYGWVEFVAVKSCASAEEASRFYERQGNYLALLYALEATDFHFENLVAEGEHPVLIDLEALFHPRVADTPAREAGQVAAETLEHSVLRVGLLPQRRRSEGGAEGADLSGLGEVEGKLTPFAVPKWEKTGTDEMIFTRSPSVMGAARHRPTVNGEVINLDDHVETIVRGFRKIYRMLMDNRDRLLQTGGLLSRFAAIEVRAVLRPTHAYGVLLNESFHPDVLRDAIDRELYFGRLWAQAGPSPHLERIVPAELADLQCGDIPIFTSRPNSRSLWTSSERRSRNSSPN